MKGHLLQQYYISQVHDYLLYVMRILIGSKELRRCSSTGGASLLLPPEGRTFASYLTASPISYANPNYNENKSCTKEQHCAQRFGYQGQRFGNWFRVEEQEYSDNCAKNQNINCVSDPPLSIYKRRNHKNGSKAKYVFKNSEEYLG